MRGLRIVIINHSITFLISVIGILQDHRFVEKFIGNSRRQRNLKHYKLVEIEAFQLNTDNLSTVSDKDCPKCKDLQMKGYHYHQGNMQWKVEPGDYIIPGHFPPVLTKEEFEREFLTFAQLGLRISVIHGRRFDANRSARSH